MTATFSPGPTANTVRTPDGAILTAPEGWVLLPPGDAALTRRVKEAGDHWVVAEKKGRKVFSQGVWAWRSPGSRASGRKSAGCSPGGPTNCWHGIAVGSRSARSVR